MSDRPLRHNLARTAALALSLGLATFVIVNAQVGCDSPASTAPPPKDAPPVVEPPPPVAIEAEPPAKPDSEPAVEPAEVIAEGRPSETPPPPSDPPPAANEPAANPVFMPASKSGGDFGNIKFPGEQAPTQQQNPAPPQ